MSNAKIPEPEARDRERKEHIPRFFDACANGDADALRGLLAADPTLIHATAPESRYDGWTGLHSAAKAGNELAVRLLLEHGADPNASEAGDRTTPLHWAAAAGEVEATRALLEAGADAQGAGDVHELDVIGWATFFHAPGDDPMRMSASRREVVSLLLDHGAKHHIFSAIAVGDLGVIRQVVEENPRALERRTSRFEGKQTPLHFAMNRKRYDILSLLIELGADLEAPDASGQTALGVAMLRGDRAAMTLLHAAGAAQPAIADAAGLVPRMRKLSESIKKVVPMILVPDVARALDWYVSLGFTKIARYEDDGLVNFGMVSFGGAELMLSLHGQPGRHDVSLWFYTDQVDAFYEVLRARQLEKARAMLAGEAEEREGIDFEQDISDMFYGARQFCIRDPNGYSLYFIQTTEP